MKQLIKRQEPEKPKDFNASDKFSKPSPEKSVKQMVQEYGDDIIGPPVPPPRTKIKQVNQALKGFTESYAINVIDEKDHLFNCKKIDKNLDFTSKTY